MNWPATDTDPARAALSRLIADRREDMSALSRLIGRNSAYIQQYLRRGTPRRLPEAERRTLAAYFGVEEVLLGAPERPDTADTAVVRRYDISAAAGAGAVVGLERDAPPFHFDRQWLRQLSARPDALSIIRVHGESMLPTLADGDEILVDGSDGIARLRNGIYVLRRDEALLVKRLQRSGIAGQVDVISDNPSYPSESGVELSQLAVVGRVLWASRLLG